MIKSFQPALARVRITLGALAAGLVTGCGGGGGNTQPSSPGDSGPVTISLAGSVLDKSGAPVPGVSVSLFHTNQNTTLKASTNASGAWKIDGVQSGNFTSYQIYAEKPGWGFYPSLGDSSATVAKADFGGLYRTVLAFAKLPDRNVVAAGFTASRSGDRTASLARTGQTVSYAPGDDAAALNGVAWPSRRFTDNLDGTVSDGLTGLVWLRNAGCFSPSDWTTALAAANQLASGNCGLTDGSRAGQWRMPNVNELESLVDVSQAQPALPASRPFINLSLDRAYWSSTTYMALRTNAMAIRFTDGRWINGIDAGDAGFSNDKSSARNALWAVRSGAAGLVQPLATGVFPGFGGGSFGPGDDAALQLGAPLTSPRFIDNGNGTLSDTVTGLTWLRQADCIRKPWAAALTSIAALASGQCALSDGSIAGQWRMPNRAEMLSLSDRAPTFPQASYYMGQYQGTTTINGPVIFNSFIVGDYYWTSSTDAADPLQAWSAYSCDFGIYNLPKTDLRYALAVR